MHKSDIAMEIITILQSNHKHIDAFLEMLRYFGKKNLDGNEIDFFKKKFQYFTKLNDIPYSDSILEKYLSFFRTVGDSKKKFLEYLVHIIKPVLFCGKPIHNIYEPEIIDGNGLQVGNTKKIDFVFFLDGHNQLVVNFVGEFIECKFNINNFLHNYLEGSANEKDKIQNMSKIWFYFRGSKHLRVAIATFVEPRKKYIDDLKKKYPFIDIISQKEILEQFISLPIR